MCSGETRTHQDDEEEEDAELDRDDLFEFCTVRKRHCSSSEMNEYLSASFSREDLNADPLQFWQKSSCSSPKLAKVAVKLYSTLASSMPGALFGFEQSADGRSLESQPGHR